MPDEEKPQSVYDLINDIEEYANKMGNDDIAQKAGVLRTQLAEIFDGAKQMFEAALADRSGDIVPLDK